MRVLALVLTLLFFGAAALAQTGQADAHRARAEQLRDQLRQEKEKYDETKLRAKRHEAEGNGAAASKDREELRKLKAQMRETKYKIKQERRKARQAE